MTNRTLEEQVKKLNTFLITWKSCDKAQDAMIQNIVTDFANKEFKGYYLQNQNSDII